MDFLHALIVRLLLSSSVLISNACGGEYIISLTIPEVVVVDGAQPAPAVPRRGWN